MTAPVRRVVAAVDGSANGERALRWAIEIAVAFHAEVVAVHAVGLLARVGPGPLVPAEQHLVELRQLFEGDWCRPLDDAPVTSRRLMVDGPPVEALLRTVRDVDADLVVVGRRGAGGFPELVLGSTSHQLAEHSDRPVIIIPSSAPG